MQFLTSFIKQTVKVIEIFVKQVKDINGINAIIQHGKENQNRANLLLIGTDIPGTKIKEIIANIKEKYNFYISYMSLTVEQYEQMSSMGLYSGSKRVLYEKE